MKAIRLWITDDFSKWVDVPIPEGGNFISVLAQARFENGFTTPTLHVPWKSVHLAFEVETAGPLIKGIMLN